MRRAALIVFALALLGAGDDVLELSSLDGRPVALSRPAGPGALVVHFWATWCPSCVEELPLLARAAASCGPERVRVVTVNVGESEEEIQRYLSEHRMTLEVLSDPRASVWRELSGDGLPLNLTWTAATRRVALGPRSEDEWVAALGRLGCSLEDPSETRERGSTE